MDFRCGLLMSLCLLPCTTDAYSQSKNLMSRGITFDSGSQYILMLAPESIEASYNFILPNQAPESGQILRASDSEGHLEWSASGLPTGDENEVLHGGVTPSFSKVVDADVGSAAAIQGAKIQAASSSNDGVVTYDTATPQTFGGKKIFANEIKATGGFDTAGGAGLATSLLPGLTSAEDAGSFTVNFTGAGAVNIPFYYARSGKALVLSTPGFIASCPVATTLNANGPTGLIPVGLRPFVQTGDFVPVYDGSYLPTPGFIYFNTNGTMSIQRSVNSAPFSGGGNCGVFGGSWSYRTP